MPMMQITIPDRIHAALEKQGQRELGYDANAWLKHLLALATSQSGVLLKLELAPLPVGEVPLFESAGIDVQVTKP